MKTFFHLFVFTLFGCNSALCQDTINRKKMSMPPPQVTVRVLDKETFKPVNAKILIVSQNTENQIVPVFEDRSYKYKIPINDTTTFSIYASGYETLNESILANEINGTEVFYLTPKKADAIGKNAPGNFETITPILKEDITSILYFSQSNTNMRARSRRELEEVVDFLAKNETYRIELAGHTDNIGDADKNMELSNDRASLVKQYLVTNNVSPTRIKSKAFGSNMPAAPNDTERNRRFNRRVVIRLEP